jgi:hypothetical protein
MKVDLRDQEMTDSEDLSTHSKWEHQSGTELLATLGHTPNAKLLFSISQQEGAQRQSLEANANPFGSPSEKIREADGPGRIPVESMEGWTFQGRKKQPRPWHRQDRGQHNLPSTPH